MEGKSKSVVKPKPRADGARKPDAPASTKPIWMADKVTQTPVADLKPYANNNRIHTAKNVGKLKESVAKFGFVTPILVDLDRVIIAGHGRYEAAKSLGLPTVPTVVADHLSPAEVRALRIADNRLAELSDWNQDALQIEFAELMDLSLDGDLDFTLDITGFETPEIDIIIGGVGETEPTASETVEEPDPAKPVITQPGDLWILGDHRVLCGNSLEEASYARVLDGEMVGMVFTDPPYNVPVNGHVRSGNGGDHREAKQIYGGVLDDFGEKEGKSTPKDEMQRELERRWKRGGLTFLGGYTDSLYDKETNEFAAEFVRQKIRQIVKDPATAELLCPSNEIGVKRICVDTGYFEIFNRPNVDIMEVRQTPIERISEKGIVRGGVEHAFDSIVYATGFDAFTGSYNRIDIRGRKGLKLRDHWKEGPRNFLGMAVAGFPNMFTVTGPLSPSVFTNMLPSIEQSVEWITDTIDHVQKNARTVIEATPDAEDDWVRHCDEVARPSLRYHADCWYLGSNIPGKPRVFMPYNAGLPAYIEKCNEVVANGYEGFAVA